jgi:hypothetical protein
LIAALFVFTAAGMASGPLDSWEAVQALPAGSRVELSLMGDRRARGTIAQVLPDGLTLTRKRDSVQVPKSDISQIWVLGKGSRLMNVAIAALIGFASGCPIGAAKTGYLADMNNPGLGPRAEWCLGLGGFAAGIAAPFPATKRTLVYRSPAINR